jgi:hypothetical protein
MLCYVCVGYMGEGDEIDIFVFFYYFVMVFCCDW